MRLLVGRDPTDVKSWIALGNEYFDSGQRTKAIEAYDKALKLQPNNADVLTDQAVMYRELGQAEKAIANFQKASKVDPKHVRSMLNLGVLYAQDLKNYDKALESWQRVVAVAPASREAEKARVYMQEIKDAPKPK
ncbi:MAG: tetratricopeptide repeat protein [Myxococcales bacterium]